MADFLDLLVFSGLIAAQFLAAVVVHQYGTGFPSWHDSTPQGVTLVHHAI